MEYRKSTLNLSNGGVLFQTKVTDKNVSIHAYENPLHLAANTLNFINFGDGKRINNAIQFIKDIRTEITDAATERKTSVDTENDDRLQADSALTAGLDMVPDQQEADILDERNDRTITLSIIKTALEAHTLKRESDVESDLEIGHYYIFTNMNLDQISSVELVLVSQSDSSIVDPTNDVKVVEASYWNVSNFPAAF